jgi:transglutaminase-like putative cysteine protease
MTVLKLCSKAVRPGAIYRIALLAVCAALALLCSPPPAAADSAPDWLRALAQEKLPEYPGDTIAVNLLDELQTTVLDNGEIVTRRRIAYKLLRPQAKDEYGYAGVRFDNETKVTSFNAWTITKDGHEFALKDKDSFERSTTTYEVFSDDKEKIQRFSEANPGSVVGYEYVQRKRPFIFEDDWWFQDKVPLRHGRLILQLPAGWEFTARWFNYADQKPQSSGSNQYVWEVNDIPAIDVESDMPPPLAVAGWVGLKYFPHDPAMRARTTGSWNDLGLWYAGLTQTSRTASPEIKQKVAELTAGMTDPVTKMRTLTEYMQKKIRYVAIEFGIGGYQPHPAGDVFTHQYGDCKDKATLLSAMLHEAGIESYYVVVDDNRGIVRADYPSIHFNHVIVAIRLPEGMETGSLYAIVNDPKLGRLLFFDPTNEYVPLGYLPWYLQNNHGLVVTSDGGNLLAMPLLPPSTNRRLRTATFSLSATGDLTGDVHEMNWGGPAARERKAFLEAQSTKRAEVIEGFLGGFLNNFTLTGASLTNLEKYDQNFGLDYKFVSPGYANASGDMLFLRPRVVGDQYSSLLRLFTEQKPRKYGIEFSEATRQDDLFDITLPPGYVVDGVPLPVQADCAYASYHSEIKVADGVLHYKRTFEIKDVEVPAEKLPEIRNFLKQVAADQQASALLRRATP